MSTREERTEELLRQLVARLPIGDEHHQTNLSVSQISMIESVTDHLAILDRKRADDARADALYPEHAKLRKVKNKSQAIGEFLDHVPAHLMQWVEADNLDGGAYVPLPGTITTWLADYYQVDLNALEKEKRAMLDSIREGRGGY